MTWKERSNNNFAATVKEKAVYVHAILLLTILSGVLAACSVPILSRSHFAANENQILLADIPEENIYLYANSQNIENGLYKEFILQTGKDSKQFSWESTANKTWGPVLLLEDLTGDGAKELMVKLVYATGTEVYAESVHILAIDTLQEFKIQDAIDIVNANAQFETHESSYEIKINDVAFTVDKSELASPIQHLFS
jgi:hypothetical protein